MSIIKNKMMRYLSILVVNEFSSSFNYIFTVDINESNTLTAKAVPQANG
jgi:hypothetical protein